MQIQAESIVSFLSNANLVKLLKQDKGYNLQLLQEQYNIGPAQIEALYHFAKNKFECGIYQDAAEFLYHYRYLPPAIHCWLLKLPNDIICCCGILCHQTVVRPASLLCARA